MDGAEVGGVTDLGRLMVEMRPRLHRYCARMVGSALDGEDLVQEALARAAAADRSGVQHLERWLFRIAHNVALDALRARRRQAGRRGEGDPAALADPDAQADRRVAASAGLAAFLALPPAQRSTVILADVLGHSLAEITAALGVTLPAAKAALHRGRERLKTLAEAPEPPPVLGAAERIRLAAYADRFNARDFDGLRALLTEDVRLDLVARVRLSGREEVGGYFTRYSTNPRFRAEPCLAEGRPALRFSDPQIGADYVVLFTHEPGGGIRRILDFRYAPYAGEGMRITPI